MEPLPHRGRRVRRGSKLVAFNALVHILRGSIDRLPVMLPSHPATTVHLRAPASAVRLYSDTSAKPGVLSGDDLPTLDDCQPRIARIIVNIWNSLPNSIVEANSVNAFKARLDIFWLCQEVMFDFTADLNRTGNRSVQ